MSEEIEASRSPSEALQTLVSQFETRWKMKIIYAPMGGITSIRVKNLNRTPKSPGKTKWIFPNDSLVDEEIRATLPQTVFDGKTRDVPFFVNILPSLPIDFKDVYSFIYNLNKSVGYRLFMNEKTFEGQVRMPDLRGCFYKDWCFVGFPHTFYGVLQGTEEFVAFLANGKTVFGSTIDLLYASDRATLLRFFRDFPFITLPLVHEEDGPFEAGPLVKPPKWIFSTEFDGVDEKDGEELEEARQKAREGDSSWRSKESPGTPAAMMDHFFVYLDS